MIICNDDYSTHSISHHHPVACREQNFVTLTDLQNFSHRLDVPPLQPSMLKSSVTF
uniref:Uncharacterized protein n=1 Tax=Arion vulgaris TaxID=1028688 RepID=A0A0B6YWN2_9EUPU